jgi:hypothetical protein
MYRTFCRKFWRNGASTPCWMMLGRVAAVKPMRSSSRSPEDNLGLFHHCPRRLLWIIFTLGAGPIVLFSDGCYLRQLIMERSSRIHFFCSYRQHIDSIIFAKSWLESAKSAKPQLGRFLGPVLEAPMVLYGVQFRRCITWYCLLPGWVHSKDPDRLGHTSEL